MALVASAGCVETTELQDEIASAVAEEAAELLSTPGHVSHQAAFQVKDNSDHLGRGGELDRFLGSGVRGGERTTLGISLTIKGP
jgi:hypothetical protein